MKIISIQDGLLSLMVVVATLLGNKQRRNELHGWQQQAICYPGAPSYGLHHLITGHQDTLPTSLAT